jgi:hypothetical protein
MLRVCIRGARVSAVKVSGNVVTETAQSRFALILAVNVVLKLYFVPSAPDAGRKVPGATPRI